MEKLLILEQEELSEINGGSELSEGFFKFLGAVFGHAVNLHQAMQGAARAEYFGNAMYYK